MNDLESALPSVLLVENEWLLADTLAGAFEDAGFRIAGPVATVVQALAVIERSHLSAAALDVSLGGGQTSYPVASVLRERGIPFLFLTGYVKTELPPELDGEGMLAKPVLVRGLEPQLRLLLAPSTGHA